MNFNFKWLYISLAVISIVVSPFATELRFVGYIVCIILSAALIIENKDSKGKVLGGFLYFIFLMVALWMGESTNV
ncbi:hypothetical protein A8F94_15025 [Bacillus sp. FJAT-27225]|uniref:hypothetical protein n=1 Tax=Bacillus sp. FJAT-27225 TaxID=1743144 RepID=UPI00080C3413|nr:hypothetical protein [Bacillus sp. FJAT-27225]OCA84042.1 hypothetical protein A8F94_15025 [Bacillus sp. FJAT-27225]